eukprot:CAMPEP_0117503258 /NCGR_PEP_ID=MMETSP0784-20121206/24235_1 /TAXON_ID=39447 /ORGANISM="" /LENGTH=94 /DNA_ID=CAMNT_0005298565 /DNA_START=264 /DNA_END=548 /DNA_ORIENTATION=+
MQQAEDQVQELFVEGAEVCLEAALELSRVAEEHEELARKCRADRWKTGPLEHARHAAYTTSQLQKHDTTSPDVTYSWIVTLGEDDLGSDERHSA